MTSLGFHLGFQPYVKKVNLQYATTVTISCQWNFVSMVSSLLWFQFAVLPTGVVRTTARSWIVVRSLTMWGYLDSTTNAARLPTRAHYAWISRLTPCRRFSYGRSSLMLFNSSARSMAFVPSFAPLTTARCARMSMTSFSARPPGSSGGIVVMTRLYRARAG